ncbi:MAG: hypothetical protein JRH16_22675, partial [Deltaproteobacteria bacterium]|nr:hypothetical protein [Deltaproteobacteria bacterium]
MADSRREPVMNGDTTTSEVLAAWIQFVRRYPWWTIASCALVTAAALACTITLLGINSDTIQLFPDDLPARRNHDAFIELFPDLENALLIVIDAETPDRARDAADRLVDVLSADRENFDDVYLPGGGSFFEEHALLYQSVENLDEFAENLIRLQPIVGELEQDGSIGNLASLIHRGLDDLEMEGRDDALWSDILDRVSRASVEIYREHPIAVSWEELMLRGSAIEVAKRRVVVAHPVLDFGAALPARAPLAAVRAASAALGLEPEAGVRLRITGNPALTYDETIA